MQPSDCLVRQRPVVELRAAPRPLPALPGGHFRAVSHGRIAYGRAFLRLRLAPGTLSGSGEVLPLERAAGWVDVCGPGGAYSTRRIHPWRHGGRTGVRLVRADQGRDRPDAVVAV